MEGSATLSIYDRESTLQSRLNVFFHERFGLPPSDYYSRLDMQGLIDLKNILSEINNIFTLKIGLKFVNWLGEILELCDCEREEIRKSMLRRRPNANGYDIEVCEPTNVIAEVKCNIPINGGIVYGSAQRDGILKDIRSLMHGKSKARIDPDNCLKFLVLMDTPKIRIATKQLVENMKQDQSAMVFVEQGMKPEQKNKLYIVFIGVV